MRNSILIALFMNCAYQVWMVSGQNCTAPDQKPPYSHACIFHCMEILYDKGYCNTCSKNKHPIELKSLHLHIPVRYDAASDSIISLPSCSGCESEANKTDEHIFVEYVQPEELIEFYDLTDNLTVNADYTTVNDVVHELYTNLTNRFDEPKKWCVNALGIEELYNKFKIGFENVTGVIESETALVDTHVGTTTMNVPINQTIETFGNETSQHQPTQSNQTSNPVDNIMKKADDESLTTTEMPEQPTVQVQNDTSKMRNIPSPPDATPDRSKNATITIKSANKPQLHDHHFHHTVTIITAVTLILLSVLIISIAVIGFYVNRHKNMGAHLTSSRTYVFDQQN